jgi:hypothetical protein
MYSYVKESIEYPTNFVNPFDKLHEQREKLFNISEIDELLSLSDKKYMYC